MLTLPNLLVMGTIGLEFVVGSGPAPILVVRDAQHEDVFAATS
jgi:hypothetical protein